MSGPVSLENSIFKLMLTKKIFMITFGIIFVSVKAETIYCVLAVFLFKVLSFSLKFPRFYCGWQENSFQWSTLRFNYVIGKRKTQKIS